MINWISVDVRTPLSGDYVVVYNGKWLWSTLWVDALRDRCLPMPVTHWATHIDLPYPMKTTPSFAVDPGGLQVRIKR